MHLSPQVAHVHRRFASRVHGDSRGQVRVGGRLPTVSLNDVCARACVPGMCSSSRCRQCAQACWAVGQAVCTGMLGSWTGTCEDERGRDVGRGDAAEAVQAVHTAADVWEPRSLGVFVLPEVAHACTRSDTSHWVARARECVAARLECVAARRVRDLCVLA